VDSEEPKQKSKSRCNPGHALIEAIPLGAPLPLKLAVTGDVDELLSLVGLKLPLDGRPM